VVYGDSYSLIKLFIPYLSETKGIKPFFDKNGKFASIPKFQKRKLAVNPIFSLIKYFPVTPTTPSEVVS